MLIASFDEWKSLKISDLSEDNPMVKCPDCGGAGEVEDFCECCGRGDEVACGLCDERGKVRFLEVKDEYARSLNRQVYFKEVVGDLKKWCAFTRDDFLDEVAGFIKKERGGVHV